MGKEFVVKLKLLSLLGRIQVFNPDETVAYESRRKWAIRPTWHITDATEASQLMILRRKLLSLVPTWMVSGELGEFLIKQKIISLKPRYYVVGGRFDGAGFLGSFFGLTFKLTHNDREIAQAVAKIMTIRDTHTVKVIGDSREDELMTVLAMVMLLSAKQEEERNED